MANSHLQLVGQLKAQADRLTALVANAGATVPASAGSTFSAAIQRTSDALSALASTQADAAALAVTTHDRMAGAQPQAAAIAAQVNTLARQRMNAANAALQALDREAATVIKALDARFTAKKPAGLSDDLLIYKAQQLEALFARKGGDSPAMILNAVKERLLRALDTGDAATVYAIVSGLGTDYAEAHGIDRTSWDAAIANTAMARSVDDAQMEGAAALYTALTRGGAGGLQEFTALAGVLMRSMESLAADQSIPASMRGVW